MTDWYKRKLQSDLCAEAIAVAHAFKGVMLQRLEQTADARSHLGERTRNKQPRASSTLPRLAWASCHSYCLRSQEPPSDAVPLADREAFATDQAAVVCEVGHQTVAVGVVDFWQTWNRKRVGHKGLVVFKLHPDIGKLVLVHPAASSWSRMGVGGGNGHSEVY